MHSLGAFWLFIVTLLLFLLAMAYEAPSTAAAANAIQPTTGQLLVFLTVLCTVLLSRFTVCLVQLYTAWNSYLEKKVKQCIAVNGTPISQLRDVTCHMGPAATRHK